MRLKLFWSACVYVEKLRASDQLVQFNVNSVAANGTEEARRKLQEELILRIGTSLPAPKQERSDRSDILALVQDI